MKKLGIIGIGWLGNHLAQHLSNQYQIFATTTTSSKVEDLQNKGYNITLAAFPDKMDTNIQPWDVISQLDAIIITMPFSGIRGTQVVMKEKQENLLRFLGNYAGPLFLMSSTGVYPQTDQDFSEEDMPVETVDSEHFLRKKFPQANVLRLAGLMGDQRLLKNYNITNLSQPVNHIHYADIANVVGKMLDKQSISKVYNVVAPLHPSKEAVINAQKNLPYHGEIFPEGRTISPQKLITELNFEFRYPDPRYFHL